MRRPNTASSPSACDQCQARLRFDDAPRGEGDRLQEPVSARRLETGGLELGGDVVGGLAVLGAAGLAAAHAVVGECLDVCEPARAGIRRRGGVARRLGR
jgi:hypothetical protein